MRILVAGGAGYIGRFLCDELLSKGHDVVLLDDFSFGHRYVSDVLIKAHGKEHLRVIEGSVANINSLRHAWDDPIDGVIYLVSKIYTQEAEEDPLLYFTHNVSLFIQFLTFMIKATPTRMLLFSSSGTVYGDVPSEPVDETFPANPVNPYSETKLYMERMCRYLEQAHGLRWIGFRYFNAAGANEEATLGEDHPDERHLIPLLLEACKLESGFKIFGTDYPTKDGTAVRDYVHVKDIAAAHTAGLTHLSEGKPCGIYNIGTGNGFSVKEIIDFTLAHTGINLDIVAHDRRPGDVPYSVAKVDKALNDLQWKPEFSTLDTIIESAWRWHNR